MSRSEYDANNFMAEGGTDRPMKAKSSREGLDFWVFLTRLALMVIFVIIIFHVGSKVL